MKLLLLLIFSFFLVSTHAWAEPKEFICSLREAKIVAPIVRNHSSFDKNRHCSMSCMLSLKCSANEVIFIGVLKEVSDYFGPGDADAEDLRANKIGVGLAKTGSARSRQECLDQCDLYYPDPN